MTKTFREVPDYKLAIFSDLAAGDCFFFNNTYYMKLITEYNNNNNDDDGCWYNSVDLKSGVLTFFSSEAKVKPYKDCTVVLYE